MTKKYKAWKRTEEENIIKDIRNIFRLKKSLIMLKLKIQELFLD